jgi:cell division protein ZapA
MGRVGLTVNGRTFAIACEDGQETRISKLGEYVDAKVAKFVESVGQVGEARLLLLAALVIADELADTEEALRLARNAANVAAAAAASGILAIAKRVETVAARIETS